MSAVRKTLDKTHPEIASEWHPTLNGSMSSSDVSSGAKYRVFWLGATCGHTWEAAIKKRCEGSGCPFCTGQSVLIGFNDLATTDPDIAAQWHPELNSLTPQEVTRGSHKRAHWLCGDCGSSWESSIKNRATHARGRGCPVCAGRVIAVGINDLKTTHPDLAAQWHPTLNSLTPQEVTAGSSKAIHWLCDVCDHAWVAQVFNRSGENRRGCPECARGTQTSKGERQVAEYIRSILPSSTRIEENTKTLIAPYEIDVYVPRHKIAVEYNGLRWHSTQFMTKSDASRRHYKKWKMCHDLGIRLITVWEDDWLNKQALVKGMLAEAFGKSKKPVFDVHDCVVHEIDSITAREYIDANDIFGMSQTGKFYLALMHKSSKEILAAMVLQVNSKKDMTIAHYAYSAHVDGGYELLMSWIDKRIRYTNAYYYVNHENDEGSIYESYGWSIDKVCSPDYKYVYKGRRERKSSWRIEHFKGNPNLTYQEGLSERELAELNQIYRVYDHGKTRYVRQRAR